jgi:hypothetical protein
MPVGGLICEMPVMWMSFGLKKGDGVFTASRMASGTPVRQSEIRDYCADQAVIRQRVAWTEKS